MIVVAAGVAVTGAPVVALKPAAGDHAYVVAPVAVRSTEPVTQKPGAVGVA
jgi:hypothetical protein